MILRMAVALFKYELADPGARIESQRCMSEVHDLQDLMVRDARMHEARGDMDGKAESREPASSFEATGDVVGQCDPLPRDPEDHLARLDYHKTSILHVNTRRDVLEPGVILDVVDLGFLLEYRNSLPSVRSMDPGPICDLSSGSILIDPFPSAFSISAPIKILMSATPFSVFHVT